jgi:hypothetical protein
MRYHAGARERETLSEVPKDTPASFPIPSETSMQEFCHLTFIIYVFSIIFT